jgi:subtilisin family serine protease
VSVDVADEERFNQDGIVMTHFEWIAERVTGDGFSELRGDDVYVIGNFIGYSGRFSATVLAEIQAQPEVAYIEEDKPTYLADVGLPFEVSPVSVVEKLFGELVEEELELERQVFEDEQASDQPFEETDDSLWHRLRERVSAVQGSGHIEKKDVQYNAPWNLARVGEQRASQGNNYFQYDGSGGGDAIVFVVDTGVNIDHSDFKNTGYKRAFFGFNAVPGEDERDYHSHGSHVAGIAAGATWGVAKKAFVVSVKVMNRNGGGTETLLLSGLNWVARVSTRGRRGIVK